MADNNPSPAESGKLARLRRWLQPAGSIGGTWVETVVFSSAVILIGRYAFPEDPLLVHTQFPWSWFAPVLLALRYGVLPGIASSSILLAGWYLFQPDPVAAEVPKLYFLGGLLLVMISGEYSGLWRTRLRRLTEVNSYLEDRTERIIKRLYLLRLSHERLEQDMLSRPSTLRDAVGALRKRVASQAGQGPLPGAQNLIEFLGQYCQLEVAAIYATQAAEGAAGTAYERVAAIGGPPDLRVDDPLFVHARLRHCLAHIQTTELDKAHPTEHLVVAPIESAQGRHLGMLVITRMPFFAMNEEMLQTIVVLLSVYADGITAADQIVPLMAIVPGMPVEFAEEFVKLSRLQRDFDSASHIVMLVCFGHPERLDILAQIRRERRLPDIVWVIENFVDCSFFISLMPLAGSAAVDGYLLRMENSLRETHGAGFRDLGIYPHVIPLSRENPLGMVRRLMLGKGAPDA